MATDSQIAEYQEKVDRVRAADQAGRAAVGLWTPRHLQDLQRRVDSSTAETKHVPQTQLQLALEANALIEAARAPILAAGWRRNAYAGRCICKNEVEDNLGWATKDKKTGRWAVRCKRCIWDENNVKTAASAVKGKA